LPHDLNTNLTPYLIEAGIDLELLHSCREMVVQGILLFFVIDKRKLELDDIATGMYVNHNLILLYTVN
jgi:uncharacterized protein YwqG